MTDSGRLTALTGLVLSPLFALVVLAPAATPVRLPLVLAFACLGPGTALVSHARIAEPAVRWAMALLLSLAVTTGTACAAAWLHWWHPVPTAVVTAGLVAASCAWALARSSPPLEPRANAGEANPSGGRRLALVDAAVLAAALALWAVALARTQLAGVGEYGLLATVHPAFFAALLLCCGGFFAEVRRGARRVWALLAYVVLLILLLHSTVPLLLSEPEYAWTYKHVGVVEMFQRYGRVIDADDIYQSWPGLFAGVAHLADLSGAAPLALARFTPVLLNLIGAAVLLAIARTLSADRRVSALTVFVFLCVNWIEEDYLAPQGLAYLLSLGVLLVALAWLRRPPADTTGPGRWRAASAWLRAGGPPVPAVSRTGRAAALGALVLLHAVLIATHQLSPYLVAADLLALVLLGLVRPWWTALVVVALPVLYLLPRLDLVTGSFSIFDSLNIFANAGGSSDGWGSRGQTVSAVVVRVLALGVWAATALIVARAVRRREAGRVLAPAVLAVVPFLLLFAQSYGGEAIYRVYLFSVPWCAFLIAEAAAPALRRRWPAAHRSATPDQTSWRRAVRRPAAVVAGAVLLSVLALATTQGRHGQLMVDRQTPGEVAAAEYLYQHATPDAVIMLAAPNFPSRLTAGYGSFNREVPVGEPDLVKGAELRHVRLDRRYLPEIEQFARSFRGSTRYLVISDGMRRYAEYFGYLPGGSLDALDRTLATSADWSLFYRRAGVSIYQLTAG